MEYKYPNDGRLHTRYSELVRATPAQVEKLILERFGLSPRFENKYMEFGTFRHKMFDREMKKTGYLPKVFKEVLPRNLKVDGSEYYFETPLTLDLDGEKVEVVIHSTTDAYKGGDYIADFKVTTSDENTWGSKQQLIFYAYLLGHHGIKFKRTIYLLERWDEQRRNILDYRKKESKIQKWKLQMVRDWIEDRVFALKMGTEMFLENNPGYKNEH